MSSDIVGAHFSLFRRRFSAKAGGAQRGGTESKFRRGKPPRLNAGLRAAIVLACVAQAGAAAAQPRQQQPIVLAREGAFEAGGKVLSGDKGTLSCDHGYVEYQIPVEAREVALFLWHSSSAKVWQNRWDGGEGYQSIFLRRGFPVYLWEGPRVGRGNMRQRERLTCVAWGARRKPGLASPANMSKRGLSARHSVPNQTLSLVNTRLPKGNPVAGNRAGSAGYGVQGPGFMGLEDAAARPVASPFETALRGLLS